MHFLLKCRCFSLIGPIIYHVKTKLQNIFQNIIKTFLNFNRLHTLDIEYSKLIKNYSATVFMLWLAFSSFFLFYEISSGRAIV